VGEVAALTGARLERPAPTGERLTGITLRAQDVRPHDLFAALPGSRAHGAGYAGQALERGAAAVLTDRAGAELLAGTDLGSVALLVVERPREHLGAIARQLYGDPSRRLAVVGVTGTSGKTTTCYLLEAALAADGSRSAVIGTVQTRIDGQITPSALTTPEAPDLQALLAVMVERGVGAVAMEVSSHALSLGRVSGTRFAVGAFTNLSQDHLDFHHDMEDYFRAKAMLFDGRAGAHVIDVDTEYGARLAAEHPEALTVSDRPGAADWSVETVTLAANGCSTWCCPGRGSAGSPWTWPSPARSTSATPPWRWPAWTRWAGTCSKPRTRWPPWWCRAGWSGWTPGRTSWLSWTTRTSPARWPPCWTRSGRGWPGR